MTESTLCAICDNAAHPRAPLPLCVPCLQQAYLYVRDLVAERHGQVVTIEGREYDLDPRAHPQPPLVYYIRFGDRIKIGTTVNLWRRLGEIPCDRLLAVEPGGVDVESERHGQFAQHRLARNSEWFRDHPAIRRHVNQLRRIYGDPADRRYADGRLVSQAILITPTTQADGVIAAGEATV